MATSHDFRSTVANQLNRLAEEGLEDLIREVLSLTKEARVRCNHCGRNVHAQVNDAKAVVDALNNLANQGFGKPKETLEQTTRVDVTIGRIRELPDTELAALAHGDTQETPDSAPLPPTNG